MTTPSHHPDDSLLNDYASGLLESGKAVIISTHLEMCSICSQKVEKKTQCLSDELFNIEESDSQDIPAQSLFQQLKGRIENEQENHVQGPSESNEVLLQFQEETFNLPASLSFIQRHKLKWRGFAEKSGVGRVTENLENNLFFIYVAAGESIPEHGHSGRELGCVLHGQLESQGSKYKDGDFVAFNEKTKHAPRAISEDGCLVVVWLEKRLDFLSGLLRPLNAFLWWLLNRF